MLSFTALGGEGSDPWHTPETILCGPVGELANQEPAITVAVAGLTV
jgi:hypothetical protein